MRNAAHGGALWLVTDDKGVGLPAVQEPEGYPRKRGVEQGALALYDVPMSLRCGGRQPFDGARDEVGHDSIDCNTAAGNEHAGLSGCPELGVEAPCLHFALKRERRILLADRAISPDGQEPLAAPLCTLAGRKLLVGVTHIEQTTAMLFGGFFDGRNAREASMQSARHVETCLDRVDDARCPIFRQNPSGVGDADNERLGAPGDRLSNCHICEAKIGAATREPQLT